MPPVTTVVTLDSSFARFCKQDGEQNVKLYLFMQACLWYRRTSKIRPNFGFLLNQANMCFKSAVLVKPKQKLAKNFDFNQNLTKLPS